MDITISKANFKAIIRTKGAELISLKNSENTEFIWEGNPEFWGKHSPVLFPIVGTLKNNTYRYKNQSYHLSRHGFARDMEFDIVQKTEDTVIFCLKSSDETRKIYPFQFELQLIYAISDLGLEIQYKVFNKSTFDLPFSLGAHPAFALPGNFSDYAIEMEKDEKLQYNLLEHDLLSEQTGLLKLSNKKLDLNYKLFENDALVFKNLESKAITILHNTKPVLKICFQDFPNLGIWTKLNAPFICIEPWFGYSDNANSNGSILDKEGIQILKPGTDFIAKFQIKLFS